MDYAFKCIIISMERDSIEIFVKVVQLGSFAEAARQLKIPTTTVSSKIARLERKLGTTLIQRTTRSLNITPAGKIYFDHCLIAIRELLLAEMELESATREPTGTLKITCTHDVAHTILPPVIEKYLHNFPKVTVELIITNRVVDLIAEGVDLAIRAGELVDSQMIARKLVTIKNCLWASPLYLKKAGIPRNPKELENHAFITFKRHEGSKIELYDGRKKVSLNIRARIVSDELESLKIFAERHQGIVRLAEFIVSDSVKNGKLVQVLPDWNLSETGKFSLVYPSQQFVTPKLREFIKLAVET